MTRFFLLVSIVVALSCSCSRKHIIPQEYVLTNKTTLTGIKHLMDLQKDSLKSYNTTVDVYGKYFSGVSYIKNIQDSSLRVLFTTHTGMKLLDLELVNNSCNTKYVVEQMNNDIVLKLLCHDYSLLTGGTNNTLNAQEVKRTSNGAELAYIRAEKGLYYYVSNKGEVTKIVETTRDKNKIQTVFELKKEDSSLVVKHYNFKFELNFNKVKKD